MQTSETLGVDLRAAVATFAQLHGATLQTPEDAYERCQEVSQAFTDHCHQNGVPARLITGGQFGEDERFPGIELLMVGHFAVLVPAWYDETLEEWVGDVVIDWTIRQFAPAAPVPQITPLDEWRATWRHLGPAEVTEWEVRSAAMATQQDEESA